MEGNVLFNDALNTFYLRLYGVRHMVKDHSDSEKGNPLPHRLLFSINSKDRIAHTTAFVTPVMDHWLEREIAQWIHPMKDRSDDPSHHKRTLLPRNCFLYMLCFYCIIQFGSRNSRSSQNLLLVISLLLSVSLGIFYFCFYFCILFFSHLYIYAMGKTKNRL